MALLNLYGNKMFSLEHIIFFCLPVVFTLLVSRHLIPLFAMARYTGPFILESVLSQHHHIEFALGEHQHNSFPKTHELMAQQNQQLQPQPPQQHH
jgi:hypothetical protein